jgi:conjugal transfer/entry exclusion protein
MKRVFHKRRLLLALCASVGVMGPPRESRADLFGGDLPLLAGILVQSISTVTTLVEQLNTLRTQITLIRTMLSRLNGQSFTDVSRLLADSELAYSTLMGSVRAIGHTVAAVNRDFNTVFPSDLSHAKNSDFDPLVAGWQTEILGSSLVAARAQTSLATLSKNTTEASAILTRSGAATGQVAQLQAIVQMLAVIQGQTNLLVQALDTAGRVTTDMAASSAAERILSREKKRRNLQNYTSRGAQVRVMPRLPDPH